METKKNKNDFIRPSFEGKKVRNHLTHCYGPLLIIVYGAQIRGTFRVKLEGIKYGKEHGKRNKTLKTAF